MNKVMLTVNENQLVILRNFVNEFIAAGHKIPGIDVIISIKMQADKFVTENTEDKKEFEVYFVPIDANEYVYDHVAESNIKIRDYISTRVHPANIISLIRWGILSNYLQ